MILSCECQDPKNLRLISDACRDIQSEWFYLIYTIQGENLHLVVSIPKVLQSKLGNAGDWVKKLCSKGGGRPDFAQGGGVVPKDLVHELANIEKSIKELLA